MPPLSEIKNDLQDVQSQVADLEKNSKFHNNKYPTLDLEDIIQRLILFDQQLEYTLIQDSLL